MTQHPRNRVRAGCVLAGISLIAICKCNGADPKIQTPLADVLAKIANRHPMSRSGGELLPVAHLKPAPAKPHP
jgi:hypothetical protein